MQVISRQERLEKWISRFMACRSSGMTIRIWCQENQVPEKSYYFWQRHLFGAVSRQNHFVQPVFAEITPPQPIQTAGIVVTVRCSGMKADIYNGADAATIKAQIRQILAKSEN